MLEEWNDGKREDTKHRMKSTGIVEGWKDGGRKSLGDRRSRRSPRAKTGRFRVVPLGFATDAPCGGTEA